MKFEDSFVVPVDPATAWDALTDIGRVAPCLPGAELVEVSGDEFHGVVRLKLGPITANYKGTARFESLDPENRRLVIHAQGRDGHGQGTASARVEAVLDEHDGATLVKMVQVVTITGKAAQFGRGVLNDVSKQMMGQFADSLTDMLRSDGDDGEAPSSAAGAHGAEPTPPTEPIDVASVAYRVAQRRLPLAAGVLAGLVVLALLMRRLVR